MEFQLQHQSLRGLYFTAQRQAINTQNETYNFKDDNCHEEKEKVVMVKRLLVGTVFSRTPKEILVEEVTFQGRLETMNELLCSLLCFSVCLFSSHLLSLFTTRLNVLLKFI